MILTVKARVIVTLEMLVPSAWNESATAKQIMDQARESALRAVRNGVVIDSMTSGKDPKTNARLVSEPAVTIVLATDADENQ
jgi:hypothetical protein